jgi:hypothetical protein
MRKIIDGKRYDTETATHVANFWNGYPKNDFKFEDSDLYVTRSGNWFLAGRGGPMSRWSAISGNMSTYGCGIAPMTREQAREMLEQEGMTSAIEKHFSTEIQDA